MFVSFYSFSTFFFSSLPLIQSHQLQSTKTTCAGRKPDAFAVNASLPMIPACRMARLSVRVYDTCSIGGFSTRLRLALHILFYHSAIGQLTQRKDSIQKIIIVCSP
jgi:hypothetical protein